MMIRRHLARDQTERRQHAPNRRTQALSVSLGVAAVLLLASCTTDRAEDTLGDATPSNEEREENSAQEAEVQEGGAEQDPVEAVPVLDEEEPTPIERYEAGELSFRDPAEAGFAPVEDLPIADPEDVEPVEEVVETPTVVLPDTPIVEVEDGTEVLSTVDVIDDAPPAAAESGRDGRRRNDLGELLTLDDDASVACGNAEVALTAIDENNPTKAAEHQAQAARFASGSRTRGMSAWASTLDANETDPTTLVAFLKSCSGGGYEL